MVNCFFFGILYFSETKNSQDIPNPLPILDTLQEIKFFAGERRYSH